MQGNSESAAESRRGQGIVHAGGRAQENYLGARSTAQADRAAPSAFWKVLRLPSETLELAFRRLDH